MKLKMLTRMAAMVAAGSLVVGLLAGCSVIPSKDGAADSAVATDTALILTQGDGMPAVHRTSRRPPDWSPRCGRSPIHRWIAR